MRMALLSGSNINDEWTTTTTDHFRDYPYPLTIHTGHRSLISFSIQTIFFRGEMSHFWYHFDKPMQKKKHICINGKLKKMRQFC